jgi:hypothetical protein
MVSKKCNRCGVAKVADEFYKAKAGGLGLMSICKTCHKDYMRYLRNIDPRVRERERERAKKPHRRAKRREIVKRWRIENPAAYRAQTALSNALRDGKLTRPDYCQLCGERGRVHGHHSDYDRPLEVKWVCPRCHHRMHHLFPTMEGRNKGAPA